jgi:ABC-type lipoprotein release transport system permease subunit
MATVSLGVLDTMGAMLSVTGIFGVAACPVSRRMRSPRVLAGVVPAIAWLGLLATWIPARRTLSLDPAALLREE